MHSWAISVDFNLHQNPHLKTREQNEAAGLTPFTDEFLEISRLYVNCGYDFKLPDGMHFELK